MYVYNYVYTLCHVKVLFCHICNVIKYDGVTNTPNLTFFNLLLFIKLDKKDLFLEGWNEGENKQK